MKPNVRASLLDAAASRPILADGAMGTQLQLAELQPGACGELWNVSNPSAIEAIHRSYLQAGAEIILTNTFGGNRIALDRHDAAAQTVTINEAGAQIARRAADADAWVLGDVGPIGGFIAPLGEFEADDVYQVFLEQARALVSGGIDGIIIETMSALDEITLAIKAAHDAGAKLVIATMAFDTTKVGARTMMGTSPEQAAAALHDAGAHVMGANCGMMQSMTDYADVVQRMRAAVPALPVIVQPNAGQPRLLASGAAIYADPVGMADQITILLNAGASIIGGCCGTTPDHIRAFARVIALQENASK